MLYIGIFSFALYYRGYFIFVCLVLDYAIFWKFCLVLDYILENVLHNDI